MKRYLLLALSFVCLSGAVEAQNVNKPLTLPNGLTLDSAVNATAEIAYARIPGDVKKIGLSVTLTKYSGTVAGKVYVVSGNASNKFGINAIDSAIITDATATYTFWKVDPGTEYVGLKVAGTGTMGASYSGTIYIREK